MEVGCLKALAPVQYQQCQRLRATGTSSNPAATAVKEDAGSQQGSALCQQYGRAKRPHATGKHPTTRLQYSNMVPRRLAEQLGRTTGRAYGSAVPHGMHPLPAAVMPHLPKNSHCCSP